MSLQSTPNLTFLDSVDSTMDVVKSMLPCATAFGVVAQQQTAGRGSGGRAWSSPLGGNLFLSLAVPKHLVSMAIVPVFPLVIGLVVRAGLVSIHSGFDHVRLKWPNDVLLHKRKAGGTIIEDEKDSFVVGIGLNLAVAPDVLDGGRPSCALSEVALVPPREMAEAVWAHLMALLSDATTTRESIIKRFQTSMEWDIELFKRTPTGRGQVALKPVRLTEWGQLVVKPAAGNEPEETLTAEYLF